MQVTWTPDGVIVEGNGSKGVYATVDQALSGIKILLEMEEEAYLFPKDTHPTSAHVALEKFARSVEDALTRNPEQDPEPPA